MTETEHLHLKKPGQGDYYNVDDFNGNADLIDTKLKEIDDSVAQPNGIATLNAIHSQSSGLWQFRRYAPQGF